MRRADRKKSFKEIVSECKPHCTDQLESRVRAANSVAKICTSKKDTSTAYKTKDCLINHGLCLGVFHVRSDEEGRSHLLRVGTKSRKVHIPIGNLSPKSRLLPGVQAVLGYRP